MSKGILFFAFNNTDINYINFAEYAAKKAKDFLDVPISLVTDNSSSAFIKNKNLFDSVIITKNNDSYFQKTFYDGTEISKKTEWKNSHRDDAYNLSPYDETLVLDVDYIVNSNVLSYCWDQPHDFLIYKDSFNLSKSLDIPNTISEYSIPFYWATVFYFKKNHFTKSFFEIVSHIKNNWYYYKKIYQFNSHNFRNDFAFSIAINIISGLYDNDFAKKLPGKLFYITDRDYCIDIKNNDMKFLVRNNNNYIPLKISNTDVHIMNKFSLSRVLNNE